MVLPTKFATGLSGTDDDFANAPGLRTGAVRIVDADATIAGTELADVIWGLFPVNEGAVISAGSIISCTDIDTATGTSLDVGIAYEDTTQGTDALDCFVDGSTITQGGGTKFFDDIDGLAVVATGRGYVTAQIKGAAANTAGTFRVRALVGYSS